MDSDSYHEDSDSVLRDSDHVDSDSVLSSDILVLKLISVLVFILFSSQNFYLVLVFWINDNSTFL